MPATNPANHQARVGIFYNAVNSGQVSASNGRQLREMRSVSNTPHGAGSGADVPGRNEVYRPLSFEELPSDREQPGCRVAPSQIETAMKKHPWATGVVVAALLTAVTVAVVASQSPDSALTATQRPDSVPQPQPLIMSGSDVPANNETVVGICERAIHNFPPTSDTPANLPSMTVLQTIKSDAENILRAAQGMARDSAAEFQELESAAQCSGVRLMTDRVEAMIADLQAMKSRLYEDAGGASVDMALRVLATQMQAAEIDRRLSVLAQSSSHLYDATVILNARLLEIAG